MMNLEQFGFRALWSPYFLMFTLLAGFVYYFLIIRKQHLYKDREQKTNKQYILFYFTLLLLYIVKGSPVDLLGHIMFTFHMVQMALLYLLIPPLLIKSIPDWVWRRIIHFPLLNPFYRFLQTIDCIAFV